MKFSGVMEPVKTSSVLPMTNWKKTNVAVMGMGRSGQSAADLLLDQGSNVILVEEHPRPELEGLKEEYERRGAQICFGNHMESILSQVALLVVSPGVPNDHSFLEQAHQQNIPVIGEIELATWFLRAPIIAVTGTNGKSTTVRLIGSILEKSGKHVFMGGNLGLPLCEAVPKTGNPYQGKDFDYIVAEVSSFQLETIHQFKPWISVLLNVTPDHLDRHLTQEEYQAAKQRIFENQTIQDWMIINVDDPTVRALALEAKARRVEFSLQHEVEQGIYAEGDKIRARLEGKAEVVFDRDDIPMRGLHNVANAMAAICVGLLSGCSKENIVNGLKEIPGFEHALEYVRTWKSICFINDSKGTNVDATLKAVQCFDEPVILILGGKDKGGDFARLVDAIHQRVKNVVVIGEAAPRILFELGEQVPTRQATSLKDAVAQAVSLALPGDVVLFSPACSSFDMFQNYHQRGLEFKRVIQELQ